MVISGAVRCEIHGAQPAPSSSLTGLMVGLRGVTHTCNQAGQVQVKFRSDMLQHLALRWTKKMVIAIIEPTSWVGEIGRGEGTIHRSLPNNYLSQTVDTRV